MASAIERFLFPEGNFQQIKATAPDQRTYNIEATKDLVENLPGGVVKDILAPAAAGIMSPFYDAIQAATRMQPGSGVPGFVKAFRAENPLSSAFERMTGAAGSLYDRLSNFNMPNVISTAQASEITPTDDLQQRIKNINQFGLPINYSASDLQAAAKRAITQPRLTAEFEPENFFGDTRFTAKRVDPYTDNTTAPAGGNIVDVAAVQEAIARAKQREADAAVANKFADFAPPRKPNIIGRDPMAQFEEESRSTGSFDEIYDTFRDNLRPPSKINEGLATLLSLAGLVSGSTPIKALGAGANIASGKAGRMLKGAKNFNQRIRQSDFGQSKSLADFLSRRRQRDEAASKKTRDEARKITQRISKQKPTPQDRGRGSTPTRTSTPSRSRRSSSSYTEAARARRR